jgi:RNA polymerase sigma-70 factor, ECF subfamily
MSLQHQPADPGVLTGPRKLFCLQRSERIRVAKPQANRDESEIGTKKRGRGSQMTKNASRPPIEPTGRQPSVQDVMLAAIPGLRAFAISLSGNVDRADDLVQGALMRAIANIDSFTPGTNMPAWLVTILRNLFLEEFRKRRREVEDADGSYAASLKSAPEQHVRLEFKEFAGALANIPLAQREALLLVGASGFSYHEAAAICGTAVGTIKSRVNRARKMLAELVG